MTRYAANESVARLALLFVLIAGFGVATGGVTYSPLGLRNILLQSSVTGIAAVGQAFVMLTGGIDVSLYGVGVLASILGASLMTSRFDLNLVGGDPVPVALGIGAMLLVGLALGAINGALVAKARIPALIVTLGMWQIAYGAAQILGGGYTITNLTPSLSLFGQSSLFGAPTPVVEMFALFLLAHYVLRYTRFGRSVYAVGGAPASAYLSGVNVERVQFAVFVISGLAAAVAAVSIESRMMVASVRTLSGVQIDSIAAAAVGGVSIYGGRGAISGVLLGVLILAVIDSGLGALGASTEIQNTVKGAIIILATSVEYLRRSARPPRVTS